MQLSWLRPILWFRKIEQWMRELRITWLLSDVQMELRDTCKVQGMLKVNFEMLSGFPPFHDMVKPVSDNTVN